MGERGLRGQDVVGAWVGSLCREVETIKQMEELEKLDVHSRHLRQPSKGNIETLGCDGFTIPRFGKGDEEKIDEVSNEEDGIT